MHESGSHSTEYVLTNDGEFYILGCSAHEWEQPDDRWRSIADSFEFLPAEA